MLWLSSQVRSAIVDAKDKDEVLNGDDLHAKPEGATGKTITQLKGEI